MGKSVALGGDIQKWIVQGLEYVAMQTPPPHTMEVEAMVEMVRTAELVVLYLPGDDGDDVAHG